MFNRNSAVVKSWVSIIMAGTGYTLADVPNLSNLRQVVTEVVTELQAV